MAISIQTKFIHKTDPPNIRPIDLINVLRQGYSDMKRGPHIIALFYNCALPAQGAKTATTSTGTMPMSPFCTIRVPGFLAAPALSLTAAATSSTVLAQPFAKVPVRVFLVFSEGPAEHSIWQVNFNFCIRLAAIHVVSIQQFKLPFIALELRDSRLPFIICREC